MDYNLPPEYELGIPYLDAQHAQLLSLTDQAYSLLKSESIIYKINNLTEILKGIHEYTIYHFSEEEAFMETFSYSQLEAHKELHRSFIKKLEKIDIEFLDISQGTQNSILEELIGFLRNWLFEHILTVDRAMAEESLSLDDF